MSDMYENAGRDHEKGNVLFLILIAVALFAALSYAVTQSSRSGGGDANSETNLVDSATITQYPASIRTAMIRQIVSKNIATDELEFNTPSDFNDCTGADLACVFHPAGGGATFVLAPAQVMASGNPTSWVFNGENEIDLVGTTVGGDNPSVTSAEVIAFLPGVKASICQKINTQLGINGGAVPAETNIDVATQMINGVGLVDGGAGGTIGEDVASLNGQGFGCFSQGGLNVYYHVLIEQ